VTSSSFWFFGSLALTMDGALPATITESERAKRGVSETSALKMWEWMFNRAKIHFASAGLLSGTFFLIASAYRPNLRPLLYGASFFSYSVLPYTLVVLMPINNEILKTTNDASKQDAKAPEPERVDKLFSEWNKYNSSRLLIAAAAWSLGTAALLLA